MNAFHGLINKNTLLEVPLANKVMGWLLLGSLPNSWETLIVTLGNVGPEGKFLSMARVKLSFLDEEARQKDKEAISDPKALVTESDTHRGRGRNKCPQNREKLGTRSKSRERPMCFYYGKSGHFQKSC